MHVLIATNGSSNSDAALRLGSQIGRPGDEPLTILTVIKRGAERPTVPVDAILARACEIVQPGSPGVRTRVRFGHPAVEIVCEAEEGGCDLVIVGEQASRNLVMRTLVGSTTVRVVEHAPCPVVVAKGKIGPIRRILLCDSGSESPTIRLPSALSGKGPSVLSRFTALPLELLDGVEEIVVLHVMSQMSAGPGVKGIQLRSSIDELIEAGAPEGEMLQRDIYALERLGIRAQAKVRHGLVVEEILDEAQRGDYDLVVIGAFRGEGWQRILLDDLAHRIVVELDRPVLVVR